MPGWNPITGRDPQGALPAFAPQGAPVPTQGQPYIPHFGGPGQNFNTALQPQSYVAFPPVGVTSGIYTVPMQTPVAGFATAQQTFSTQPNGTLNMFPRQPQQCPNIDPTMPAAQMTNSSGGVGCEPGYNYFFPAEHTKVHVFKSEQPPWTLPANAQVPFIASHVPSHTTFAELLKGFGCSNPSPKKNKCFEIVSGGNGKWYKGWSCGGDEKDVMKQTLKSVGWDSTRAGHLDGKPVVCLWFCKN
ncbi:hypothetical protein BGZ63DRAFT_391805 [Mariannaea sp. PMI_226]|nr:hypothetical protein BGZ63DRAFT_391805 [Mariannaea sp. PMI_226]